MTTTPHAHPIGPGGPASGPDTMLGRRIPRASGDYRWVYLWEWPIRAMHWTAALCVVVLAVTGLYIGKPYFVTGGEASAHFLMGWVRFFHFAAAALLVMTLRRPGTAQRALGPTARPTASPPRLPT